MYEIVAKEYLKKCNLEFFADQEPSRLWSYGGTPSREQLS